MCIRDSCDCVHIASPPSFHLAQLDEACAAGVAVLCEKPLSTDVPAETELVTKLAQAEARTAVNFPFASSFAVEHIDSWRRNNVIGEPDRIDIEIAFHQWPRPWQMDAARWLAQRSEGGFTREVISHFLFLTARQAGPVTLQQLSLIHI